MPVTRSIYHGSHEYSTFSASTIPSTQPHSNYKHPCCFLCRLSSSLLLHPVGPFRCIWDMFVMLLLIYTSIEIPYSLSFAESCKDRSKNFYISLLIDCSLMIDIIFNFHTAYFDKYDNLRIITNKKRICKKYFRCWFWIDFITCIPSQLFHSCGDGGTDALIYFKVLRVFRLLRILKILRFVKMMRIFDGFMKQFVTREFITMMKILKIIFLMVLVAHYAACLWWFVGAKSEPSWIDLEVMPGITLRNHSVAVFTKYSYAWYWAVVTLFTTGYGDISATNRAEQWTCSICILIGTCFFAYFIGTLTAIITEGDKIRLYQTDKIEEAQSFCEKKKLPKELTRAILTHIRYHATYNYVFDENELLSLLPAYLQHDIHSFVARQFLLQLKIFQNAFIELPDFIIGLIAVKCKSISCNQTYKLFDIGDISKEIYIQRTGQSSMYDKNGRFIRKLSRGSVCGEYSSFLFKKRTTKLECDTWSEFYAIDIDDIKQILHQYFPKSSESKWKQIKAYLKTAYRQNKEHSVEINHYNTFNDTDSKSFPTEAPAIRRFHSQTVDTVHLFNNIKSQLKFVESREQMIRMHSPVPPILESDIEDDVEDDDIEVKLEVKRTDTKKPPTATTGITAKLYMRSNSEIRDSLVIAHAQKHTNAALYVPETKLIEIAAIKADQMPKSASSLLEFEDSECSLFSSDDSDDYHQTKYQSKILKRKKRRQNTKKKRRMKLMGKATRAAPNTALNISTANVMHQRNKGPPNTHRQISTEPSLNSQLLSALMAKQPSTMRFQHMSSMKLAGLALDLDDKSMDINENTSGFDVKKHNIPHTKLLSLARSNSI